MWGNALGNRTRRKMSSSDAAYDRISSTASALTETSPRSVFTSTGKKHRIPAIAIFECGFSTPNQAFVIGANAMIGIALSAVPIIAFAPITNAWFGVLNPHSKMAIAAILCFFPVLVNTLRGLTSVRPQSIELMHSYAAGETEIFRRVRFPSALPHIFAGLRVATVLAMIGAIVGDYFGGAVNALGVQIENSISLFDFPLGWAAIVVASAFGIAFYVVVIVAERFALRGVPPQ